MVEVYQFGPFNSEDGTMSLMHPSLSPTERLVKKSAYDALAAELAEATSDCLRWHRAYMDLKYPNGPPPFPGSVPEVSAQRPGGENG